MSRSVRSNVVALALVGSTLLCLGGPSGCAGMGRSRASGPLTTRSFDGSKALTPQFTTAVYEATTIAAAEIYLTDLPIDRLSNPRDNLSGLSGSIIQLRLFVVPQAGKTPISNEACNLTMRHIVLSSAGSGKTPEFGIYGGGGFLLPADDPGEAAIGGSMSGVTLRPLGATAGFIDLLGPSDASGGFNAKQDAQTTRSIAARVQRLIAAAEPVAPAPAQSTSIASPNE